MGKISVANVVPNKDQVHHQEQDTKSQASTIRPAMLLPPASIMGPDGVDKPPPLYGTS